MVYSTFENGVIYLHEATDTEEDSVALNEIGGALVGAAVIATYYGLCYYGGRAAGVRYGLKIAVRKLVGQELEKLFKGKIKKLDTDHGIKLTLDHPFTKADEQKITKAIETVCNNKAVLHMNPVTAKTTDDDDAKQWHRLVGSYKIKDDKCSIRMKIKYYVKKPNLPKPKWVKESGMFDEIDLDNLTDTEDISYDTDYNTDLNQMFGEVSDIDYDGGNLS